MSETVTGRAAAASTPPRYATYAADPRTGRDVVLAVWREGGFTAAGPGGDGARYDWFYLRNPEGPAQVNLLESAEDGRPIGCLGVGPRRFVVRDRVVAGGMLVDFVVHPEHRTALPALTLQRAGRQRALESMQILYGLPDKKAVMVFKRLGGQVHFELPSYSRVVRCRNYLGRHVPAFLAASLGALIDAIDALGCRIRLAIGPNVGCWLDDFDERFDTLWNAFDKTGRCIGVRDRAFLQWRFGAQPGHTYRIFGVMPRGSNALRMYFICEVCDRSLIVKDCLCLGSENEVTQALLMLAMQARAEGLQVVHLQIAAADRFRRALRRAQFVQRSARPFFAMLDESLAAEAADASWYITQADEDV